MSTSLPVSLADVEAARELLAGTVSPTPMQHSEALSEHAGTPVHLKLENLQRAGSFKIRGAYTRMSRLSDAEKAKGVVCASAGNHAQGVALAAKLLGISATVYMPHGAPMPKLEATQNYGATVEQVGTTIDECLVEAARFEAERGATLIHPFDHEDIVAGQGTCGLEILEQVPDVQTIICPTGGGGLIAGILTVVKEKAPHVKVVGVQAEQAAAYPLSLDAGKPVALKKMRTMADGIAVGRPGIVPFSVIESLIDGMETVSEAELARALVFLLERAKQVSEPAGAAAVAHLLTQPKGAYEGPLVSVVSGGNIDPILLLRVIRSGLASAGRYLQLRVRVPDSPGSLAELLRQVAELNANVVAVDHVRESSALAVTQVEIALTLETMSHRHASDVVAGLRGMRYEVIGA